MIESEPEAVRSRYAAIYARWLALRNYAAVGREIGVTGDRIRQICAKFERMEDTRRFRERLDDRNLKDRSNPQ
jgi:hypothetical protein